MARYSIKEVELLTGVKAHTLRIWEQRYDAVQPHRTQTNIRYYDDDQLRFLINVSLLLKHGKKVSKIFQLSGEQMKVEINNLESSGLKGNKYIQVTIDSLLLKMMDLQEEEFNKTLSQAILRYGFEECMVKIIIPCLEKVGVLWATDEINVAQEHFISNLIRRKLMVAIDSLPECKEDAKKFILFLPEGELHEIGLLFAYYALKRRGFRVIYLGQSVPMDDLINIDKVYHTNYLLTYLTINLDNNGIPETIRFLEENFKGYPIFVAGSQASMLNLAPESPIRIISSVEHLIETLDQI